MFLTPARARFWPLPSAVLLLGSTEGRDKPDHSHPLRPAADRHDAGARDLDQAERDHERDEAFDLLARTGDLEDETFGRSVDHAGAERVGEPQRLHAMLALAAHLDHGELALDVR